MNIEKEKTPTRSEIRQAAIDYRRALAQMKHDAWPFGLSNFPSGWCKFASWILGRHLMAELGCAVPEYVFGDRGWPDNYQSHGWLECSGLIVDITADQFSDMDEPVVVVERSDWHITWSQRSRCGLDDILKDVTEDFRHTFDEMCAKVNGVLSGDHREQLDP